MNTSSDVALPSVGFQNIVTSCV